MPRYRMSVVTPPGVEPVTVAELKEFARIDSGAEDVLIDGFITAARAAAENYTRRAFNTQTWKLSLDLPCSGWGRTLGAGVYDMPVSALYGDLPRVIDLPLRPLLGVTSVTGYAADNTPSVYADSNYTADLSGSRLVLAPGAAWPSNMRQFAAVEILTTHGYGPLPADVPMPIRTAIMIHAGMLYETRGMCGDDCPPAGQQLLRQYRVERL